MAFTYRKQMTPGMKACKDYFESGKKMERPKKITKDIPPQIYKLKKWQKNFQKKASFKLVLKH